MLSFFKNDFLVLSLSEHDTPVVTIVSVQQIRTVLLADNALLGTDKRVS